MHLFALKKEKYICHSDNLSCANQSTRNTFSHPGDIGAITNVQAIVTQNDITAVAWILPSRYSQFPSHLDTLAVRKSLM